MRRFTRPRERNKHTYPFPTPLVRSSPSPVQQTGTSDDGTPRAHGEQVAEFRVYPLHEVGHGLRDGFVSGAVTAGDCVALWTG